MVVFVFTFMPCGKGGIPPWASRSAPAPALAVEFTLESLEVHALSSTIKSLSDGESVSPELFLSLDLSTVDRLRLEK